MGFKLPKKTALMRFEGTDYDGAEVRLRLDVPLELLLRLEDLVESDEDGGKSSGNRESIELFGDEVLIEWNLEDDDGNPIPATAAGMLKIPPAFSLLIGARWNKAITDVPDPLGETSSNGGMSAADLTALVSKSESLG